MKLNSHHRLAWLKIFAFAAVSCAAWLQAADNVAPPNIVWHNRSTGENKLWTMNGANFTAEIALAGIPDDPGWKMVGTGDVNGDGEPDLVWQHEITGQNAVWYMHGTNVFAGSLIQAASDRSWKMVGVADFNGDGKPDLLWQNVVLGQNAVWLMNGITPISYNMIIANGDSNWRIVATGDLNQDGKPDIILRHQVTGQNAVWYMNGLNFIVGALLHAADGSEASIGDQDWQIVGTADFNRDGKTDLLWRHCTLGLNLCWYLNGSVVTSSTYLGKHEFDTDWRVCSEDTAVSTWRLGMAQYTWLRGAVSTSPPQVILSFNVPPNGSFGSAVQRRSTRDTAWTTLATGVQGSNFTDSTVAAGQSYEYRVYRESSVPGTYSTAEHLCVALNPAPIEDRGKVLVLVDATLASQLVASLEQLKQDLIGDGWKVARYDVPRHIDDYSSSSSFRTNAYNVTNVIKPLIRSAFNGDASTKAVVLVGHVAIPYSGVLNTDGHSCGARPFGPDHHGAWPADMFYGDLDGTWTDSSVTYTNCDFLEPNNVPNDGKFDQDGIPSPYLMKLAVGRIDFARLPVLTQSPPAGVPPRSEAALLQQYLNKDHLYRLKGLNWQQTNPAPRALVYGHFHDARDNIIFENARHALGALSEEVGQLVVGDFCLQRTKPSTWGFISGAGLWDRVNEGLPVIEHTAADLADPANEPRTAFYTILGSYMGDWNLNSNNYLRTLLSTPNYGLAAMWTRIALWRVDAMGLGEHLGASQLRMVNDPKLAYYERVRDLAILGDPTLRLHVLAPALSLKATTSKNNVQLSWSASESGAQYYVYRGASQAGPFTRISSAPVAGLSFTDSSPVNKQKTYMVRALKAVRVANGSYTNISQGVYATLP